jgi:hypothetical protein
MDKLLDKKRKYTGYDGEEYIDMCIPVVSVKDIQGNSIVKITQDSNGRIDTFVWNDVEKNMDMIDTVMYANHIFNPFSIKEGDVLIIPIDNDRIYVNPEEPVLPNKSKHSNNIKGEKTRTYAETIEYLGRKGLGLK